MNIQYTDKINAKDGVKSVLYGPSGIGKTRLIATAPRPFIFNAEKGLLSLKKFRIPYVTINTYKELEEAFLWATKSAEAKNYDTFALDSLSEIAEVVMAMERKKNPDPRKYSPAASDSIYHLVRSFRDLPQKHIVCIAKQMAVDVTISPVESIKCMTPMMPGDKLQNNLPYFWDIIAHMYNGVADGKTWEALHTRSSPYWVAKDRGGNLDEIEYPDLSRLFSKAIG